MTITVALERGDTGIAVPIEISDPNAWSAAHAREFVHMLWRLLGGGGIHAQAMRQRAQAVVIEVLGVGGRLTTPLLPVSPTALAWLQSATFELPRR